MIELGWLEREYTGTNKTKWDGVLFKTGQHCISPGFIEFSGGSNGASTTDKEHNDVMKLYRKMIDVLNAYPPHVSKEIFCMRYYGKYFLSCFECVNTNCAFFKNR